MNKNRTTHRRKFNFNTIMKGMIKLKALYKVTYPNKVQIRKTILRIIRYGISFYNLPSSVHVKITIST